MAKLKKIGCAMICVLALNLVPIPVLQPLQSTMTCEAMTYDEFKQKISKIKDGAKKFWDDSASDRSKLTKKAKKKWQKLQKKIKKEYKKAKKKGKKGLAKFKKWRKRQEKEFWQWYARQMN